MLLTPQTTITIGAYTFTRCNSVEIERSIRTVQSVATIKVPVTAVLQDKDGAKTTIELPKAIKRGDKVKITLSYKEYPEDTTSYDGYVKRVNYAYPCVIECEDLLPLRNKQVQKAWKSVTVKEIMNYLLSGTDISLAPMETDITLAPYTIKKGDAAFALQKLVDDTGMTSYKLDDGTLYFGLAYTPRNGDVKYNITGEKTNVIDAAELKYHLASEQQLKIRAVNINGDNTRTEVTVGEGPERTFHFYNIASKAELEKRAIEELQKYKFDGYQGKLKTFLIPPVDIGYKAAIADEKFDRSGDYFVEKVTTKLTTSGVRKDVEISLKLNG